MEISLHRDDSRERVQARQTIVSDELHRLVLTKHLPVSVPARLVVRRVVDRATILDQKLHAHNRGEKRVLRDRVYVPYETHTLELDETEAFVRAIYVTLDPHDQTVSVNMHILWLRDRIGVKPLPFAPSVLTESLTGLELDPRYVPQNTPLWALMRGDVTGSKFHRLLGMMLPEDPNWAFGDRETLSEASKVNMRFGKMTEIYALMMYRHFRPNIAVQETGFHPLKRAGIPFGWGSSPDGLLEDLAESDPRKRLGVLEIKSSQRTLKLADYHIPQAYMEMMATDRWWCDVCRYCKPHHSKGTPIACHIYRIVRDPALEKRMLDLALHAYRYRSQFRTVVQEPSYVELRKTLKHMAETAVYEEHTMCDALRQTFIAYDAYRNSRLPAVPEEEDETFVGGQPQVKKARVASGN